MIRTARIVRVYPSFLYRRAFSSLPVPPPDAPLNSLPRTGKSGKGEQTVRVRYAPSPTGSLHLGGLRTALYNFLFARASKGSFIVRIEDTDQKRLVSGAQENLLETLKWAGLEYDEGPDTEKQPYGPYVQSERLPHYRPAALQLVASGFAYPCFCSAERLEAIRQAAHQKGASQTFYDRHCAAGDSSYHLEQISSADASGRPYVIRMKIPGGQTILNDAIRGKMIFPHQAIDDQILLKSDGFPTYHLAVVVDDYLMKISHVIRGEEWLPSTPKHILLYKMLNYPIPVFAHLPLLLKSEGIKLSKRNADASVSYYREKGFEPAALMNFIAFLGWNPGSGSSKEIFSSLDELAREFSLSRVRKSGAIVDQRKLLWYNGEYLKREFHMNFLQLAQRYEEKFLHHYGELFSRESKEYYHSILWLLKDSVTIGEEFVTNAEIFYREPIHSTKEARELRKKIWPGSVERAIALLEPLIEEFEKIPSGQWKYHRDEETMVKIHESFNRVKNGEGKELKNSEFFGLIRYSLTGREFGPSLPQIVATLGKDRVLQRLRKTASLGSHKRQDRGPAPATEEKWNSPESR